MVIILKSNYNLLWMSLTIERNSSKHPLCHFTIRFHNSTPTPKSAFQGENNRITPKTLTFQQDQSSPIMLPPNVSNPLNQITQINPTTLPTHSSSPLQNLLQRRIVAGDANLEQQEGAWQEEGEESFEVSGSLIEELMCLQGQQFETTVSKKQPLLYLDIGQTQSIQQQDSQYFQEQHSQVIQLTQEEKNFFNNFITHGHPYHSPFTPTHDISLEIKAKCVLSEKRKLIRNFFRPKGSFLKDDRTSCNSYTNIDEIYESSRKSEGGQWGGLLRGNENEVMGS